MSRGLIGESANLPAVLLNGRRQHGEFWLNRGMAYGDGLFETLPVIRGEPLWLEEHLARLQCDALRLGMDVDEAALREELAIVMRAAPQYALLKIVLTRVAAGRGYAPPTRACDRLLQLFPSISPDRGHWRDGVRLMLCQQRLARQPALAGIKHLNRLEQVLAAGELRNPGVAEGLMLDVSGLVIEGTRSNVFLVKNACLVTPALEECGVAGIMRAKILEAASELGLSIRVGGVQLADLQRAEEVFICNSVFGIWPVTALGCVHKPIGDVSRQLQRYFDANFYA